MGLYNPNSPLVVGNEYAPVLQANYHPDLFVERGWSFRTEPGANFSQVAMFVDQLPAWSVPGHAYLVTLYRRGQEVQTGPMQTVAVPLTSIAGTNTALGGGAPSTTQSVANPTDGWYTRLRSSSAVESYARFRSNTIPAALALPAVTQGKRIVDVSVLYTASAQPGNEDPVPLQINHFYNVTSERVLYGNAQVDLTESQITSTRRSRWGEICTWTQVAANSPFNEYIGRYPWNYDLLTLFSTGTDFLIEFRTEAIAQDAPREIYLHYAALQITYCEENRVGSWGIVAGSAYSANSAGGPAPGYQNGRNTQWGTFPIPMTQRTQLTSGGASASYTTAPADVQDYTVTIKRADYGAYNNQGPTPTLRALRTVDIFPGHPGVVINNTLEPGGFNQIQQSDLLPQIVLQDEPGVGQDAIEAPPMTAPHVYGVQYPLPVYFDNSVTQSLIQTSDGTLVEYPHIRFWARHNGARAPLEIWVETNNQTDLMVAELSTVQFEEFPEIADGWRQIDLEVSRPLTVDDDGSALEFSAPRWESATPAFQAWEVLAEYATTFAFDTGNSGQTSLGSYGANDAIARVNTSIVYQNLDVSVAWTQEMPVIAGLAATVETQALTVVDPACPALPQACIPTGLYYYQLSWTAVDSGYEFVDLGYYELQRRDETMDVDEWETIAKAIHPLVDSFADYEARVGLDSEYRIRYVHTNGVTGDWSAIVAPQLPEPGVTGAGAARGVLIFTSNEAPERNLAYVQVWRGAADESFDFVEAEERALQKMYGRDFQVAFRPTERGGVSFSRTIMVHAATIPVETLTEGFTSLRDLAWANLPYVCVRNERGDRWLANVNVPGGSVQMKRKLYMGDIVVTEVTGEPFAYELELCEGMTARGTLPSTQYEPRFAITSAKVALSSGDLGLRVQLRTDQDQFMPLIARFNAVEWPFTGWVLELNEDRTLRFLFTWGGIGITAHFTSAAVPFGPGDLWWARFDYDMDGGGATSTGQFYTSPDGSVWTPLATVTVDNDSLAASLAAAYPLTVGAISDGSVDYIYNQPTGGAGGWNGVILQAQMLGDAGASLATPDFRNLPSDTEEYEDAQGNIWTVDGGICTVDRRE